MLEQQLSTDAVAFRQVAIPMPDGVSLAADRYLPAADAAPVPVLLELLPYRKEEDRAYRYGLYAYFVERGYAVVRVDIRGTGSSEGRLPAYEYSEQELDDAVVVIDWLAEQGWCSGNVGMFGISWGGFNAIQLGMRAPAPLGAIVAACASDDLFFDDVHYLDGMMHVAHYELSQDLANAVTASPAFPLDDEALSLRFDTEPWMIAKLEHPQDGPFWQRESLKTDYGRLKVPALLLGGYYDGYRDSIPRMLEHVRVPVQALVGPWPHRYPHDAVPGPNVEWRDRAVRWFDHFLKGEENGVLAEPALSYYLRTYHPPESTLPAVPGRWHTAVHWPADEVAEHRWSLELSPEPPTPASPTALYAIAPPKDHVQSLPYVPSVGFEAGTWWGDLLADQAPLDDASIVFDSPPLDQPLAILGRPGARLLVSADADTANWFVRLSDVAPDGRVTLVTGAGRSGAHRTPGGGPVAIEAGVAFELAVELHFTSWVFEPGHRIRIAVANAQWPMIWPTPHPMRTSIHAGSAIVLPVLDQTTAPLASSQPEPVPDLPYPLSPMAFSPIPTTNAPASVPAPWSRAIDPLTGEAVVTWRGRARLSHPWGRTSTSATVSYRVDDARPANASVVADTSRLYELAGDRTVEWRGSFSLVSDTSSFHYEYTRELFENGTRLRTRSWSKEVPRGFH